MKQTLFFMLIIVTMMACTKETIVKEVEPELPNYPFSVWTYDDTGIQYYARLSSDGSIYDIKHSITTINFHSQNVLDTLYISTPETKTIHFCFAWNGDTIHIYTKDSRKYLLNLSAKHTYIW